MMSADSYWRWRRCRWWWCLCACVLYWASSSSMIAYFNRVDFSITVLICIYSCSCSSIESRRWQNQNHNNNYEQQMYVHTYIRHLDFVQFRSCCHCYFDLWFFRNDALRTYMHMFVDFVHKHTYTYITNITLANLIKFRHQNLSKKWQWRHFKRILARLYVYICVCIATSSQLLCFKLTFCFFLRLQTTPSKLPVCVCV